METRRLYDPGDGVMELLGRVGLVLSLEAFEKVKDHHPEGKRPGRFFAPGCCPNPDYVTQIPVLFEDGTWDVMRAVNLRRKQDLAPEKHRKIEEMIRFD